MKASYLYLSILVSAVFPLSPFISSAEAKRSPEYEKCMETVDLGAFKNTQWASCAQQEVKRQDTILNIEYNKLRKKLSPDQRDSLTKGQRSWLKFREDWCRFEEKGPSAPGGEANYYFCVLEQTDKQIDAIKTLQP